LKQKIWTNVYGTITAHVGKTVNVRKILQSQKTFANHLDDFLALQAQNEAAAAAAAAAAAKRSSNKAAAPPTDSPMPDAPSTSTSKKSSKDSTSEPILVPSFRPPPPSHPGDTDPLLMSRVPEPPSEEELRRLLAHPPLSYVEARGKWDGEAAGKYPTRKFCAVCGYWGRVRCMKCGTRVCALECLETHREECVTRYSM
jgi:zinc finger HIT domain-containing protein 1